MDPESSLFKLIRERGGPAFGRFVKFVAGFDLRRAAPGVPSDVRIKAGRMRPAHIYLRLTREGLGEGGIQ